MMPDDCFVIQQVCLEGYADLHSHRLTLTDVRRPTQNYTELHSLYRYLRCGGVVWPACGNPNTRWFRLYHIPIFISSYIIVCTVNTRRRRQQIIIPRPTLICASQCGLLPNFSASYVPNIKLQNHAGRTSAF
jgi:hypothetical protein